MAVAVPTDFNTDDPVQLRVDLEKLARAVQAVSRAAEDRAAVWPPKGGINRADADVELGKTARFATASAALLPISAASDRGRSLAVRVIGAVTVTLTPRGGQTVDGASTASLAGPGCWIAMWDGDEWTVVP